MYPEVDETATDKLWEVWNSMLEGTTYYAIRILSDTVTAFCSVEELTMDALRRAKRFLD